MTGNTDNTSLSDPGPASVAAASSTLDADAIAASPSPMIMTPTKKKYYISITSLQVKLSQYHNFLYYTIPIVPQARQAAGNVHTSTTLRHYVHYTMTV
jgi:hypothetical protein